MDRNTTARFRSLSPRHAYRYSAPSHEPESLSHYTSYDAARRDQLAYSIDDAKQAHSSFLCSIYKYCIFVKTTVYLKSPLLLRVNNVPQMRRRSKHIPIT